MTNKSWAAPPQTRSPARIPQKVTQLPNLPPSPFSLSLSRTPTRPTDNRNTSSPLRHQQAPPIRSSNSSNRYITSNLSLWCARTLAAEPSNNPLEKVKNMAVHRQTSPSDSNNKLPNRSRCTLNRWKPRMLSLKTLPTKWTQACRRTTSSAVKDIRITTKLCWQIT